MVDANDFKINDRVRLNERAREKGIDRTKVGWNATVTGFCVRPAVAGIVPAEVLVQLKWDRLDYETNIHPCWIELYPLPAAVVAVQAVERKLAK